ncbi:MULTISPECIES: HlyD family secretion protein [Desulfosediminicola]|uniref:HlyD family secretion protein n=1 Tax=Desulfosediminicola TaxID=2886823 RepID=UPI0010ADA3B4|nr:HlyD family secretion protein [Desulfosediminicola ganghwensis]
MTDDKQNTVNGHSQKSNQETEATAPAETSPSSSSVNRWIRAAIVLCLLILVCYVLADKFTPYTANARLEAFVVPIVPQVSGHITEVTVSNNSRVEEKQILAVVDRANYNLAVQRAKTELQQATQSSEADVAAVTTAQAKVTEAEANLANAEVKGKRIIGLAAKGAASQSRADDARSRIAASRAKLASARSELSKAKSQLGYAGEDNAKVQSALIALESAQLDLSRSYIRAPSEGIITNLLIDVGHYASIGTPLMTFISTKLIWIQANFRENCLMNIRPGNTVDIVLDSAPGQIFEGRVMSIGYGVSDNADDPIGGLSTIQPSQGWLRQAQHMPVLITFTDDRANDYMRVGGQANVLVYTGDRPIQNTLAGFWIRFISILSHLH